MPQCSYHGNSLPFNIWQGAITRNLLPSNIRQGAPIRNTLHKSATLQYPIGCTIHKFSTLQYPVRCTIHKSVILQYPVGCIIYKSATLQYPVGCTNQSLRNNHVIIYLYPMTIRQTLCCNLSNPPCSNYVSKIISKTGIYTTSQFSRKT